MEEPTEVSPLRLHHLSELALRFVSLPSPPGQFAAAGPGTDVATTTAGESTLPMESMKESQSLELESVSTAIPAEAERAATMPVEPLRTQMVLQEGPLGRKHDVEGSGKKSSNRSANHSCPSTHSTGADPASSSPQVVE